MINLFANGGFELGNAGFYTDFAGNDFGLDDISVNVNVTNQPPVFNDDLGLILWNRLGSETEVENSQLGFDGTFDGGGFTQGVFGGAYTADYTQRALVHFPKEVIPIDAGTIEFWAKLRDFPEEIGWNAKPALFEIDDGPDVTGIDDGPNRFMLHLNGNDGTGNGGLCGRAGRGFNAGTGLFDGWSYEDVLGVGKAEQWHHYALVWDKNGIPNVDNGTRKMAIYLDGKLNSARWSEYQDADFVPLSGGRLNLLNNQGTLLQGSVAIDNIKIWDSAKTDFSDRFEEGTYSPFTFTLPENSADGIAVGTITASDIDGGDTLTYAITGGNSNPDGDSNLAFAINSTTGEITVNDSGDLDYETTSQFTLQVTATDTGGLSDTAPVTVTLINVDEPGNDRPEAQDATFTLPENSPNSTAVGTVTATDFDTGDTLTYAITAGNSDPDGDSNLAFAINSATGAITVNDSGDLDFETTPTFNLTVKVTDVGGLSDTAAIKVNLSDIFEREGTPGDDFLSGTPGNDVLNGLAGNDTLTGGAGDDTLIGGEDIDRIQEQGDVNFTLSDTQLTGLGTDTLTSIERAILTGGSSNNTLDASAFTRGAVRLNGGEGDDLLKGPLTAGSGHILGFYANIFTGGDGDDTLTGGAGIDGIREQGDVNFTLSSSQLTGRGTDSFSSMEFAHLIGGASDNTLDAEGFTGSSTFLEGGGGNDTLIGGAGIDRVRGRGDTNFTLTATQLTGFGIDTLDSIEEAYLGGGPRNNILDASGFTGSLVILEGQGGNDTLIGGTVATDRVRARGDVDFTLRGRQRTYNADWIREIALIP